MLFAVTTIAAAQDNYPSAPIRLVLGTPPGAATDVIARMLGQRITVQTNASVVVDYKPGANGNLGPEFVAKSKPDGYTVALSTSNAVLTLALGEKTGYDLFKDLTPVSLVASTPQLLIVHPSLPVTTPAEFISYVRANPNKLSYGSAGVGNITHLGPLLLLQANGLSALHVPYKGSSFAVVDLAAGRIQFRFSDLTSVLQLIRDNRLRAIATASLKRSALLPDVPTFSETIMPGFEVGSWFAIMVPSGTPPAIVRKLNGEIVKALQDPELKARFDQENIDALGTSPEDYGAYLKKEYQRWSTVIKTAGIKAE
jgi:tripartite-type tricarboxylate transporter receptor subunit TctC